VIKEYQQISDRNQKENTDIKLKLEAKEKENSLLKDQISDLSTKQQLSERIEFSLKEKIRTMQEEYYQQNRDKTQR
jgi:hypothetical protein